MRKKRPFFIIKKKKKGKKKKKQKKKKKKKKQFTIRIKDTILPWKEAKSSKDDPELAFNWCLEYFCDCGHL